MAEPLELRDPTVQRVAISGATLAFMLQDFSFSQGDSDGIIFGRVERRSTMNLQDDDEQQQVAHEEVSAMVTGYCCSGTLFSFYDSMGRIHPKKLATLIGERERQGGDPVIGWFAGRRNTAMRPSMRETAVTAHLRSLPAHTRTLSSETRGGRQGSMAGDGPPKGGVSPVNSEAGDSLPSSKNHTNQMEGVNNHFPIMREDRISGQAIRGNVLTAVGASSSFTSGNNSGASSASGSANTGRRPFSTGADLSRKNVGHLDEVNTIKARENTFSGSGAYSSHPSSPSIQAVGIPHSSPCLFFLLTESDAQNEVQTHEYRAFQYHRKNDKIGTFEPRSVTVINVGPAFHALYNVFTPISPFPWLSAMSEFEESGDEVDSVRGSTGIQKESVKSLQNRSHAIKISSKREQNLLNSYAEGYSVGRLSRFIRENGHEGVSNLEDLYTGMLTKLESLAKEISENGIALAEQEVVNAKLRAAVLGNDYT